MGSRGRTSSASLSVAAIGPNGIEEARPKPPEELTEDQAVEWVAVVTRMPAGWFTRETLGMLVQYCRHVCRARRIAAVLNGLEAQNTFSVEEYRGLLTSEEMQSRAIAALATKMRISQQSAYDKSKKRGKAGTQRPWGQD